MNFLRRLLATLAGLFHKPASSLQAQNPSTPLTRYIFSARHFSKAKNRTKANAFLPPSDHKLSVQDISNLEISQIWKIGHNVGLASGRSLKARADFLTATVLANGLRVEIDEPPLGHRNIVGWSELEAESERESMDLLKASNWPKHRLCNLYRESAPETCFLTTPLFHAVGSLLNPN
jgi:hypothetical protein